MKIVLSQWQGRISPVFDVSDTLCLIAIENGRETQRTNVLLSNRHTFGRAKEISDLGIDVLFCGAVSHVLETALINAGIQVFSFICGDLEDVVAAFAQGKWEDDLFLMPGFHRKGQKDRCRFSKTDTYEK